MQERQLTERRLEKILNASLRMLKNSSSNLCFHRVRIKKQAGVSTLAFHFYSGIKNLQTLAFIQLQRFKLKTLLRKILKHFRQRVFHFIESFRTIMKNYNRSSFGMFNTIS
jgi:hypothetical protein